MINLESYEIIYLIFSDFTIKNYLVEIICIEDKLVIEKQTDHVNSKIFSTETMFRKPNTQFANTI